MTKLFTVIITTLLLQPAYASSIQENEDVLAEKLENFEFNFGLVLHNDSGEPVGFMSTEEIPITKAGQTSMYGLVVTGLTEEQFTLSSVHVLPKGEQQQNNPKIMGKAMLIKKRGAIFMRTDYHDQPGNYQMEIYIDNVLLKTIDYQLLNNETAANTNL